MRKTAKPELVHDVLADVLSTIRLSGAIFCVTELSAPWSMELNASPFAHFHVFERGGGYIRLSETKRAIPFAGGDLVIIPKGTGHVLSDHPETPPVPWQQLLKLKQFHAGPHLVKHSGSGPVTQIVCGKFQFENADNNPLVRLLPSLIHIPAVHAGDWLPISLRLLSNEARTGRPGSQTILSRLTDIVFVQALRAWMESLPEEEGGWLGALRDRHIGLALALMHKQPNRDWSVASLAHEVGLSRSAFASRFNQFVGEPPLGYLTRWRMHLAAGLLEKEELTVSETAERVGYESGSAFYKAFKRQFGIAPLAYRNKEQMRTVKSSPR